MKRKHLDGLWELSFTSPVDEKSIQTKAPVPGNVEPVLKLLGLMDDYLPPDNEFATEIWNEVDDWCYSTRFSYDPDENATQELVFEGIDTIAEIFLNGEKTLDCLDMHVCYRIPLDGRARIGENELTVLIRSSELWARERLHEPYAFSHSVPTYYDSQAYLRKARHQWGWDNAPRLLTCGIWRSVYVESLPRRRFEDVYLYTVCVNNDYVQIGADWSYATPEKRLSDHVLRFSLLDGEQCIGTTDARVCFPRGKSLLSFNRSEVKLWWTADLGEAQLYTVRLEMLVGNTLTALYEAPFGIRELTLSMSDDISEDGGEFLFRLNGEPLFIRGTNWKPLDPLPSIADRKTRSCTMLARAKDLHCNMIRIWGGGIYEDESFFDFCDRNGILVWQDFMFACEIPPADEDFCNLVATEAAQVVRKYRNHPSLAVYCGDNEDDLSLTWVAKPNRLRPSDLVVSRKTLREAVLHHDPYRPYIPSSPYLSDRAFEDLGKTDARYHAVESHLYPNSVTFSKTLRTLKSIFIGETGPISVNAIAPNKRIFERERARTERLWDASVCYGTASHQSDAYFTAWRQAGRALCLDRYGRDFSFAEWNDYTVAVNLACAEIFKDVIEYCRVSPNKTGVIWWSLSDMWDMLFNYSVIDSDGNAKLPYHFIKSSQQPLCLMAVRETENAPLRLFAANDTLATKNFSYTISAYGTDGEECLIAQGKATAEKNTLLPLGELPSDVKNMLLLEWSENGRTYYNHAFPTFSDFDTMKALLHILCKKCSIEEKVLELSE
ncbi:MAG: hypothetical protein E7643_05225 [Ruminococcaceae bacterium]|nr:hypothetical protein [Oscillospiraceae bacterium]